MLDTIPVTRSQAEAIAREVMNEEVRPIMFENQHLKEELRQIREGERVVMPKDLEHARAMFKMATFYLSQNDKDFSLKMSNE
jgi:hypothetical protein